MNELALEATKVALSVNQIPHQHLELIHADLLSCSNGRLDEGVDLLVFNPPYVVTDDDEIPRIGTRNRHESESETFHEPESEPESHHGPLNTGNLLSSSWAGGKDGMRVTSQFLSRIPVWLSRRGRFYLLLCQVNDVEGALEILKTSRLDAWVTMERKCGNERLFVVTGRMAE